MKYLTLLALLSTFAIVAVDGVAQSDQAPITLTNLQGRIYTNITIQRVAPDGLVWLNGTSGGLIHATNLPADVRALYGLDEQAALEHDASKASVDGTSRSVENATRAKDVPGIAKAPAVPRPSKENKRKPAPIGNLFGLKLGESLPVTCVIVSSNRVNERDIRADVVPPQRNAVFNRYFVTFDASGDVVASITALGSKEDSLERHRITAALASTLRRRYGPEDNYSKSMDQGDGRRVWEQSQRSLILESSTNGQLSISCSDDLLMYLRLFKTNRVPVDPLVDTNGL